MVFTFLVHVHTGQELHHKLCSRFFTERRLPAGPTASGDPFCLAAATFAALVHRYGIRASAIFCFF